MENIHTAKFLYGDRLGRCRFCGELVDPTSTDVRIHKVAEYRVNNNEPWNEVAHTKCDDAIPASSNQVPDGYRRYTCIVLAPGKLLVQYDIGATDTGVLLISNYKRLSVNLSVIRKAHCIYFKNVLQVDIPIDIANRLIYAEASME